MEEAEHLHSPQVLFLSLLSVFDRSFAVSRSCPTFPSGCFVVSAKYQLHHFIVHTHQTESDTSQNRL